MRSLPLSSSGSDTGREAEAVLVAELSGGRTILRRQHVGYPLHVTRAFYLDRPRPDIATLYLQSASGGLYARDRLKLVLHVGAQAALNVTTQAATVVHHGRGIGSVQQQTIVVGEGGFCAFICDPYVLFPHADLLIETVAEVAPSGVLILAEGFAFHDPHRRGEPFARFATDTRIKRPNGTRLLSDIGQITGAEMSGTLGPLGEMKAAATIVAIAPREKRVDSATFEAAADACGCLAGATAAPNDAGTVMRILAQDGGTLARGIDAAFHAAARAALGLELMRRRK